MPQDIKPIAIIGAGLAGLTAADYLRKNKVPFMLFEAGNKTAGLAASFKDDAGFSYDFGAHFVTNRLADAIGVEDECLTVKHYGERVWLGGKTYSYPFGLMMIPRMTLSGIKAKLTGNSRSKDSAADWFRSSFGTVLANEVALPLIEAWSGAKATDLSAAVGDSLPGSIAKTLYLKAASIVTRRAVACGYSRELNESASVYHVYPKNGVSTLCEKLASGLNGQLKLESPVEEVSVENERVIAVKSNGKLHEVSAVISTAPANILARLVSGTNALDQVAQFRFRPMIFVNLKLKGRGLLSDTVLWFPEDKFPFFRLTEATLSMPWLAPDGHTTITVDIGAEKTDASWNMSNEKLVELCLDSMTEVIPDIRERYLGHNILKTGISYPVFLRKYEQARKDFERSTNIPNLLSIGRNGEFSHIFMEDVYFRTRKKVAELVANLSNTDDAKAASNQ
ncbi:MAG: FAD-dependent oxidoreductase [Chloracidobacterium sp.]|nr:FAD-dependent oxidoreductase [Chloracidobacterium sp.]